MVDRPKPDVDVVCANQQTSGLKGYQAQTQPGCTELPVPQANVPNQTMVLNL